MPKKIKEVVEKIKEKVKKEKKIIRVRGR